MRLKKYAFYGGCCYIGNCVILIIFIAFGAMNSIPRRVLLINDQSDLPEGIIVKFHSDYKPGGGHLFYGECCYLGNYVILIILIVFGSMNSKLRRVLLINGQRKLSERISVIIKIDVDYKKLGVGSNHFMAIQEIMKF